MLSTIGFVARAVVLVSRVSIEHLDHGELTKIRRLGGRGLGYRG